MKAIRLVVLGLAALSFAPATAQNFPTKPLRIVVGYPPGGGSDLVSRLVASGLSARIGQQVVVDNRPGASGLIANEIVAKSPPDGYTLLLANSSFSYIPAMYTKVQYDMRRDFAPVAMIADAQYVLVVHPAVPAKSVRELVALAKAQPGKLNYASGGAGGSAHLATELLKTLTGINILHVPYKGNGPAMTATVAGEVDLTIAPIPTAMPFIHSGKSRALGTTGAKRSDLLRDVPTISEAGVAGYECGSWFGFMAPSKTPPAIVQKLSEEMLALLKSRDFEDKLRTQVGADPMGMSSQQFAAYFARDIEKWSKIIRALGIKGD